MSGRNFFQCRKYAGAVGDAESAARLEGTADGHGVQGRDCAFDGFKRLGAIRLHIGH
jgi:hypothetical protein